MAATAPRRAWIRMLVVLLGLGLPAHVLAATDDEVIELPIQVQVVPAGGQTDPDAPDALIRSGTWTAWFGAVQPEDAGHTIATLYVEDTRGTGSGWNVEFEGGGESAPVLLRYRDRTVVVTGQPVDGERGPHGERLSLGQGAASPAVVLRAARGAGWGTYQVRLDLGVGQPEPVSPVSLVLTLSSAP